MLSRVAIVGAGPAGLAAALALRRLGLEVTVFEQAEDYQRIGGGIVLHDNGQRVLQALGLLDSFRPHLQPCPVIAAERCDGRVLGAVEFGRSPHCCATSRRSCSATSCRSTCLAPPAPPAWSYGSGIGSSPPR